MNIYDMTEEAYKNGYRAGLKHLSDELKEIDFEKLIESLKEADRILKDGKLYMSDPFCIKKAIKCIEVLIRGE